MLLKRTSLTIEKAKHLVENKFPNLKVTSSIEFQDAYVFGMDYRKQSDDTKSRLVRNPIAVDKRSGALKAFNPLQYDRTAYDEAVSKTKISYK